MGAIDRIFRGRRGAFSQRPLAAQVAALFANGEQGLWYDVESFRDAWNNVGPELVTNGDFSAGSAGWIAPTGVSVAGGMATWTGYAALSKSLPITAGGWYVINFEITNTSVVGEGVKAQLGGAGTLSQTAVGRYVALVQAGSANNLLQIYAGGAGAWRGSIDNVSVKEWVGLPSCALFQDAAGTLPAYMPGQGVVDSPVGLILDRRFSLARGTERFADGPVAFVGESSRISAGVYRCYSSAGAYSLVNFQGSLTVGNWYELRFTVDSIAAVGSGIVLEGTSAQSSSLVFLTTGQKTIIIQAAQGYVGVKRAGAVATDFQISNVSIRELKGNHAYQTTTASRPTLSARFNLLTNTNFAGAAVGTPGTPPTGWGGNFNTASITAITPIGNDYAIQISATAQRLFFGQAFPAAANVTYSLSCLVVENSGLPMEQILGFTAMPSGATLQWLLNGVVVNGSTTIPAPGARIELRLINGATAGTPSARVGIGAAVNATGVVSVAQPDVRVTGDSVGNPPYQRVVDANTYDTAGFPLHLRPDGVDDGMSISSIDLSAYDSLFVCIAARKTSDSAAAMLMELSAAAPSNPGSFSIAAPESAAVAEWKVRMRGATASGAVASAVAAPDSAVISATIELNAPRLVMRRNGVQQGFNSSAIGAGNFGAYPLYLFRRAGSSLPFSGKFFGALLRAGATNDGKIAKVEKYLNQKAKVA